MSATLLDSRYMEHDASNQPPPRVYRNGPFNCYGMPEKRFWRIVLMAASVTMIAVASTVVLVEM